MRPQTLVTYELELMDETGNEYRETFSHKFDTELYEHDIEGTDVMMVNFKLQELKEKYDKHLILMEFSVGREMVQ